MKLAYCNFENKTRAGVSDAAIYISFEPEDVSANIVLSNLSFGKREKQQNMKLACCNFKNKTRAGVSDAAIYISFEPEDVGTNIMFFDISFGEREKNSRT